MENKKAKTILYLIIVFFFLVTFLFKIIPVQVENIDGIENAGAWISGGYYWTSGVYQFSVLNSIGMISYSLFFITLIKGVYLWK